MENTKYYEIEKHYLAEGMSFLDFSYLKFGYGADSKHGFEDTEKFQIALRKFIDVRNQLSS